MSSDTSADLPDRRRSKTVCFLCRQRKTKCDRLLPQCGFCIKAQVECRYVPQPKKRGLRAGYVSELESRIEKLEQDLEAVKSASRSQNKSGSIISPRTDASTFTPGTTASNNSVHPISTPLSTLPTESDAAVTDMMTLPRHFFSDLAQTWFKETQPWIPILDQTHIQNSLDALPDPVNRIDDVVLRAVLALKIAYSSPAICLGYKGRIRLSRYLRSSVVVEAMSRPALSSMKALFIIAILDYGLDDINSTFSLMAVCRRMGEHIGSYRQLLQRIESQSPAQIGPPNRQNFEHDDTSIAITWGILALDAVSSLGISWRDASAALVDHLSSVAYLTTPDLRDSFVTHIHLSAIGLQPVHEFFHAYAMGQYAVLDDATTTLCEDIFRNLMSYVVGLPESGYTLLADGIVDFDTNHIFTRLVSYGATIMIYERYLFDDTGNVSLARERCLTAYNALIELLRNVSDFDSEVTSPLLASFVCVAARFKLVYDRSLGLPREAKFDILMHALNMCGRRWPIARRLDIVLRAAIQEVDTGQSSGIPREYWDLKQSGQDMSERLKGWVHEYKPSLYVGSLNGPYV